jgi:hypothetical protein
MVACMVLRSGSEVTDLAARAAVGHGSHEEDGNVSIELRNNNPFFGAGGVRRTVRGMTKMATTSSTTPSCCVSSYATVLRTERAAAVPSFTSAVPKSRPLKFLTWRPEYTLRLQPFKPVSSPPRCDPQKSPPT